VKKTSSGVFVNGAQVVTADVKTSNGIVHIIDKVLMPPPSIVENAVNTPILSQLVTVLSLPAYKPVLDAVNAAGTKTVFAPTDAAFAAAGVDVNNVELVTKVLQYHVVAANIYSPTLKDFQAVQTLEGSDIVVRKLSSGVKVNDASVVAADVASSNGVVHVIDKVLLPPPSIVDNAVATPSLSALVSVVTMPEYKPIFDALSNSDRKTVFAPTDAAFQAAGIQLDNVALVTDVLKYHVVAGTVYADDLNGVSRATTLQGTEVVLQKSNIGVRVNDANVLVADVRSSNGVVHVIDRVLIPGNGNPCYYDNKTHKDGAWYTGGWMTCMCQNAGWVACRYMWN